MRTAKNSILVLLGVFSTLESFTALAGADSAMHKIYGGVMLIVTTLVIGLWEMKK